MTEKQKNIAWDWYDKITKGLLIPVICFAAISYINLEKTMIKIRSDVIHIEEKVEDHIAEDMIRTPADARDAVRVTKKE